MGSLLKRTVRKVAARSGSEQYTGIDPYAKKNKPPQQDTRRPRPQRRNTMGGVRNPLGMLQ